MTRTLIVGTSFIQGAAAAETFSMWASLIRRLNPGTDVLVIDSASPTPLPVERWTPEFDCISLPDNIGHLSRGGGDGWGRSFSIGVSNAVERGYDYLANIECDILFAKPVAEIIARMERANVKCCAPMAMPYQFTETGCSFWSVPYLRDIQLVEQYDWKRSTLNGPLPEQRIDTICADEMWALPLRGFRNDMRVTADQLKRLFPDGIDWLHHAELPVLRAFLEINHFV